MAERRGLSPVDDVIDLINDFNFDDLNSDGFNFDLLSSILSVDESGFQWAIEVSEGAGDVNAISVKGKTPLMGAVIYEGNEKNKQISVVKKLITDGADVNAYDSNGNSILMLAVMFGNKEVARLLLDAGADVKSVDKFGNTVLHQVEGSCINKKFISLLIDLGVSIDAKNGAGMTALACTVPGAYPDVSLEEMSYQSSKFSLLLSLGADPNCVDRELNTPLHYTNYESNVIELYYYGANLFAKNNNGINPFYFNLGRNRKLTDIGEAILKHVILFHKNDIHELLHVGFELVHQYLMPHIRDYEDEIEKMKTINIKTDLSFHKFCMLKRTKFDNYVNISKNDYSCTHNKIKEIFPKFGGIILTRIKDNETANLKKDLIQQFYKITLQPRNSPEGACDNDDMLNFDCLEAIMRNLEYEQICNFFLASL